MNGFPFPTSIEIFRNGERERAPGLPMWRDSWTQHQEAIALRPQITALWSDAKAHEDHAMKELTGKGKPKGWRDNLGLNNPESIANATMKRARLAMKHSQEASNAATAVMEKAFNERKTLHPYRTNESVADAVTRASIRQSIAGMTPDQREAFFKHPTDNRTRFAIFEVPAEVSGLDRDSALYRRLYDDAMTDLHGSQLERLDALDGIADYCLKLAVGVQRCAEADADGLGVKPDERASFFAGGYFASVPA